MDIEQQSTTEINSQPVPPKPEKIRTQRSRVWLGISIVLAAIIIAVGGVVSVTILTRNTTTVNSGFDGNLVASSEEASIADVIEKVSPSVVSIVTNTTSRSIFGATRTQAAGTGIVISKDGHILTNKHVVSNAQSVTVVTSDGATYDSVSIVGADPLNDVAYLKIDGVDNLTPATLGDSSTTRVGQSVVAIGNALGQYQNTVSSGIISGKGRVVLASSESGDTNESLTDMIQTDTAINSGNSGGPLINYAGQVIGINTAVASDAEGIGFAIPVNATKGTIKQVLAGKGVQRAYLGVNYVDITPEVASQYSLSSKFGAYVIGESAGESGIQSGSPADRAGIKNKDIITKLNGANVGTGGNLSSLLGQYEPGETVELTVIRDGKTVNIKVTLDAYSAT